MADVHKMLDEILNGKTLTEAINEMAGDWDTSSDEVYSDASAEIKADYDKELEAWKNDAIVKVNDLAIAVRNLKKVFETAETYGIDLYEAKGYPFNMKMSIAPTKVDYWTHQLHDKIVKG